MSIGAELVIYLQSKSAITDLVDATDIRPQRTTQGVPTDTDRIVYYVSGGEHVRSLTGSSGLANANIDLHCQSVNYDRANAIAEALRNELECFQGTLGSTTVQGVFVDQVQESCSEPMPGGNDTVMHDVALPISVWYEEAIPTFA